jgi:hypothetical protein
VSHTANEYARDDMRANAADGYVSILKRGMRGVYPHCREKHLHRYALARMLRLLRKTRKRKA